MKNKILSLIFSKPDYIFDKFSNCCLIVFSFFFVFSFVVFHLQLHLFLNRAQTGPKRGSQDEAPQSCPEKRWYHKF